MTGQVSFDSHARNVLAASVEYVNRLTPGESGGAASSDRTDGWSLHFHGPDDGLVNGWGAGCAAGLALALGTGLAGRLGVCAAPHCDRVFVDVSRNGQRRFCSPQCQSRVKAAAHRARQTT